MVEDFEVREQGGNAAEGFLVARRHGKLIACGESEAREVYRQPEPSGLADRRAEVTGLCFPESYEGQAVILLRPTASAGQADTPLH